MRVLHELLQKLDIDNASEKENFKKVMYYYIFCFIIFPTSENKGRKSMFTLIKNLDSIEKINWTPAILERVHSSITEIKIKMKNEGMSLVEKKEGMKGSRKFRHANCLVLFEDK